MAKQPLFVVIVPLTELTQEVIGPYTSFTVADANAKAWEGYVEPVKGQLSSDAFEMLKLPKSKRGLK